MNLVGSGVGAGSPNRGPFVGIICEFSGLESDGTESVDGSVVPESLDLERRAIRGVLMG